MQYPNGESVIYRFNCDAAFILKVLFALNCLLSVGAAVVVVAVLHVREKISTQINILSCNDPIRRPKKLVIDS